MSELKIVKRTEVPTLYKLFMKTMALGDQKGKFVVVDEDNYPYYIGTREDCAEYIEDVE